MLERSRQSYQGFAKKAVCCRDWHLSPQKKAATSTGLGQCMSTRGLRSGHGDGARAGPCLRHPVASGGLVLDLMVGSARPSRLVRGFGLEAPGSCGVPGVYHLQTASPNWKTAMAKLRMLDPWGTEVLLAKDS